MESLDDLKELIHHGHITQAIELSDKLLQDPTIEKEKDYVYYLRGNAFRKSGDWKQALDNYQHAIDLNPQSPAVQARSMAMDILDFFHRDQYNQ